MRVEDHEISLNVPDVANVIAVYESLDNGSVILDKLTFSAGLNLNTSAILGEKIIGQGSGAVAQLVTKTSSTEVEFVYLNSNRFSPSETVLFEESNIRSAINSIVKGNYINKTQDYTLDKGQKEQYYDYSRIVRKRDALIPSKRLTIIYNCYKVPASDVGDVFSVNSYDDERYTSDIPLIGPNVRSTDTLDFRPRVAEFTSTTSSPFRFSGRDFGSNTSRPNSSCFSK